MKKKIVELPLKIIYYLSEQSSNINHVYFNKPVKSHCSPLFALSRRESFRVREKKIQPNPVVCPLAPCSTHTRSDLSRERGGGVAQPPEERATALGEGYHADTRIVAAVVCGGREWSWRGRRGTRRGPSASLVRFDTFPCIKRRAKKINN